jgi:hypothetical protein
MSPDHADEPKFYTVVFEGDVRAISQNLFKVISPFGTVVAIGVGNAFEENDALEERVHELEAVVQP